MADRVSLQADKAELPAKVLLRRERQCHQDPDLGHADSKSANDTTSTETETQAELLWIGYNDENSALGLHKS